ncbi:MAG: hypothetical protein AAGJ53_02995 [Pseudomonadota bacterium]
MSEDPFVTGRTPVAAPISPPDDAPTLAPPVRGWDAPGLHSLPSVSDDAFFAYAIAQAPDTTTTLANREGLGLLAEAAVFAGRARLVRQAEVPTSLIAALDRHRPPFAIGPVLIQAIVLAEEIEMRVRALWQVTRTLGGYDLDDAVLADVISAALSEDLAFEVERRSAPIVIHGGARLLPLSSLEACDGVSEATDAEMHRSLWQSAAFAFLRPAPTPPSFDLVATHAAFLADNDPATLAEMHQPLLAFPAVEIFDIWRRNLAVLNGRDDPMPRAADAIARLDQIEAGTLVARRQA